MNRKTVLNYSWRKVGLLFWLVLCTASPIIVQATSPDPKPLSCGSIFVTDMISKTEAEHLLGQPVFIKDSLCKRSGNYLRYQFHYFANSYDSSLGGRGMIYFDLEQYQDSSLARHSFNLIKGENQKTNKVNSMDVDHGEGFIAYDPMGFPFIMITKNDMNFKFKVFYFKGKEGVSELESIARRIISAY